MKFDETNLTTDERLNVLCKDTQSMNALVKSGRDLIEKLTRSKPPSFSPRSLIPRSIPWPVKKATEIHICTPINIPARTYSPVLTAAPTEFVAKGLKDKTIRDSDTPLSSPALIISKKNGRPRTCIDHRALNKRTRRNAFPLPNTNAQVHKATYHRLHTSIERTVFTTHDGH